MKLLAARHATGAANTLLDAFRVAAVSYFSGAGDADVKRIGDVYVCAGSAGERHFCRAGHEFAGLQIARARHVGKKVSHSAIEVHA